ncbi:MAG TPA: threonine/serine exporter family protein, partial [Rudaea sp.]
MASATIAAILHSSWIDLAAAGGIGLVVGALAAASERSTNLRLSLEAISGLLATMLATLVGVFVAPLSLKAVVLSSLIVLLPGLTLTTAVRELSTEHLVSGAARLAGAMATLIKLAFGTVVANQICHLLHLVPQIAEPAPVPAWAEWVALACGCYAFAVLFRSARRDYPLVMAAVALGYVISFSAGREFGPQFGVFLGGLCMGALGNVYAYVTKRPGSIVRVPGIILLVPGSVGFLSVSLIAQHDVFVGINTAATLIGLLVCLVAGLLFGDLVFPARRVL